MKRVIHLLFILFTIEVSFMRPVEIKFKGEAGTKYVLTFTDMAGRIIQQESFTYQDEEVMEFDISGLRAGVYNLNIKSNLNSKTRRIIIK